MAEIRRQTRTTTKLQTIKFIIEVAQKSDADSLVNQTFFAQALIDWRL